MPDAKLAALIEQLQSDNPKTRAKACHEMGKLGNPEAIPYLSNVYRRTGEDKKVVAAAEKALRKFVKRMPSVPGASRRRFSARRVAMLLVISLIFLLVLNVLLRLGGDDEATTEAASTPTPSTASNRDDLVATYQTLYDSTQANFALMRAEWGSPLGQLPCNQSELRPMQERPLSTIDEITFPDFVFVDELNAIIQNLQLVINRWNTQCLKAEGQRGSLDDFNKSNDALNLIEPRLQTVGEQLNQAITNPAPTIGPTPTLTPVPGDTSPAPTATLTPTVAPPTSTDVATATPTITLTPEPTVDPTVLNEVSRQVKNGLDGSVLIFTRYWQPVQNGENLPFGCNFSAQMPVPYDTTGKETLLAQETDLAEAVRLLNEGIGYLEASVTSFTTSCQNNNFAGRVDAGIANAQQAYDNFDLAQTLLDNLRNRGQ